MKKFIPALLVATFIFSGCGGSTEEATTTTTEINTEEISTTTGEKETNLGNDLKGTLINLDKSNQDAFNSLKAVYQAYLIHFETYAKDLDNTENFKKFYEYTQKNLDYLPTFIRTLSDVSLCLNKAQENYQKSISKYGEDIVELSNYFLKALNGKEIDKNTFSQILNSISNDEIEISSKRKEWLEYEGFEETEISSILQQNS